MYKTPKWLLQLPIDSRNLTESSSLVLPTPQTFGLEKGQRSSVSLTVTWTGKDMSLLKEQPTNRRAGRFAGRTSFARPSNRWICSASTQNSATCPQVPPAGTWAGLWAGPWVPYTPRWMSWALQTLLCPQYRTKPLHRLGKCHRKCSSNCW